MTPSSPSRPDPAAARGDASPVFAIPAEDLCLMDRWARVEDLKTSHVFCVEPDHLHGGRLAFVQLLVGRSRYIGTFHSSGSVAFKKVGLPRNLRPTSRIGRMVVQRMIRLLNELEA